MPFFRRSATRRDEFESAAMPHLDELYRSARRMLGDGARADDVVQDAYLRAWRSFHTFQPGTNCRAWLYRILVNAVHDYRKRWMASAPADDSEKILDRREAPAPTPDRLTDEDILRALDELPAAYRDAVVLADVEQFSYREISELLEVKQGTVMSRLHRGRSLLRDKLRTVADAYGLPAAEAGT